eukprot:TRINITY_DN27401_c0_g2_i1.p3 TRINITY_DN27401_c0_g2~~TRINITY_DN27401_c0_g2_i1.p3  ORF type:complete len:102 (-),score=21.85 TRINITY_DN27401_c0_g2_i1:212-517(-)
MCIRDRTWGDLSTFPNNPSTVHRSCSTSLLIRCSSISDDGGDGGDGDGGDGDGGDGSGVARLNTDGLRCCWRCVMEMVAGERSRSWWDPVSTGSALLTRKA